jgi:hypothetical protein
LNLSKHNNPKPVAVTLEGLLGGPGTVLSRVMPASETAYRENTNSILQKHYTLRKQPSRLDILLKNPENMVSI